MKRWPIIRHVRWLVATIRFNRWWKHSGSRFGFDPKESDLAWLGQIWRGER